jgi:molecular chaperone DnaK (HSP70)
MLDASKRLRVGIDFGTTRTVVAVCDRGNYPVVSFGAGGETLEWVPSLLAVRGGEVRVGLEAARLSEDPSFELVRSLKRRLAKPDAHATEAELLVEFLGELRYALENDSNVADEARRASRIEAMIAAPANAHGAQRFVTLEAFRRAGFEVVGMINEPSAAAFEYAHRYRNTLNARRAELAVYDLGGGTFDASRLQMTGRTHQVLRAQGIGRLGGDDFDLVLAELALERCGLRRYQVSPPAFQRLVEHCRELKERLNPSSRRIVVELEGAADPVVLACSDYYEACAPLVARTMAVLSEVLPEDDGSGVPAGVAGIYIVGGASGLPAVGRALKERYGRRVHRSPYPSAAVAIGLAIALDDRAGFELEDRFSRVLGVFREGAAGREVTFDPLVGAQQRLPVAGSSPVLERTYRAAHNIGHFRFVECSRVDGMGQPSGEVTPYADVLFPFDPGLRDESVDLGGVAVSRCSGPGPEIRERYSVDATGLVELTITDLETGYEKRLRLGG